MLSSAAETDKADLSGMAVSFPVFPVFRREAAGFMLSDYSMSAAEVSRGPGDPGDGLRSCFFLKVIASTFYQ
jgi:hypothetical protein